MIIVVLLIDQLLLWRIYQSNFSHTYQFIKSSIYINSIYYVQHNLYYPRIGWKLNLIIYIDFNKSQGNLEKSLFLVTFWFCQEKF